jgi:hypothetical protein
LYHVHEKRKYAVFLWHDASDDLEKAKKECDILDASFLESNANTESFAVVTDDIGVIIYSSRCFKK